MKKTPTKTRDKLSQATGGRSRRNGPFVLNPMAVLQQEGGLKDED